MNSRLLPLTALLFCSILAFCWLRVHHETRALIAERVAIESSQTELERHAVELKNEIATTAEKIANTRLTVVASLTPVERARGAVGPLVARLKQEHAMNPPPARRPPPPSGPSGNIFPELLSDPEYNRLAAFIARQHIDQQNRPLLKKLGVSREVMDQVIDLLTDREMIATDTRSLFADRTNPGISGAVHDQQKLLQAKIDANIHELLGDAAYDGFSEDIVDTFTTINPDRTITSKKVTRRGIPDYRTLSPVDYRLDVLDRRLSYSPAPLTAAQKLALGDWLNNAPVRDSRSSTNLWKNEVFLQQARITLSSEQQIGLEELAAEADASEQRNKLPKAGATPTKGKPSG